MNKKCLFFKQNADAMAVVAIMLVVFLYIMFWGYSDMPAHAHIAKDMLEDGHLFAGNFLMYFMVNLLTFFSGAMLPIKMALCFLLACSNTAKYVLVRNELAGVVSLKRAKIVSLSLLFVFVVPVLYFLKVFGIFQSANTMYNHYSVPNVWHNSTILCMMPFAIITFFLSIRQFEEYNDKRNRLITVFVVLGTLVKPSFFFLYAVAYPICMLVKYRFSKYFFCSLLPIIVGILCVLYEYLTIYDIGDGSEVIISVWPLFTFEFWESRWLYFVISIAFPVVFVLFYWKDIHKDMEFWLIIIMVVVAFGIAWCCSETGERASHGNFSWQVVSAMWFVYYYLIKRVIISGCSFQNTDANGRTFVRGKLGWKNASFVVLYGLNVVTGVLYLMKYLITNSYC